MSALVLQNLTARLGNRTVLHEITLGIEAGACVGLIGPNGAGKSTLMRAALGLIPASGRSSLLDIPRQQRSRIAAWLPQSREIAWDVSVDTLVELGRVPHRRPGAPLSPEDRSAMEQAMIRTDITGFRNRIATELSGGEQARVLLARALAQDAPLLMADEPIAALDPAHQISTMETFAALAAEGRTVITALHDLGLAARWCSRLILLDQGRVVGDGAPRDVLTQDNLVRVYGVSAHIAETPDGLVVQPMGRSVP